MGYAHGAFKGHYNVKYRRFGFVQFTRKVTYLDDAITVEYGVRIGKRKFSTSKTRVKVSEATTD